MVAMFAQINALPSSQSQATGADGDDEQSAEER